MSSIKKEENEEKKRHDILYNETEAENLLIHPRHWQKFDSIKKHIHCYTYAVEKLGNIKGQRVLDLGCGNGWFSTILAKRGAKVEGIEISPVAIEISQKRAVINNVSKTTDFQCMSFYNLDYPSEYFDKIIGLSVLHHAEHKKVLMKSLYRVLKPGGRIIFNEPFGNSKWLEKLRLLIPVKVNEEDKTHWDEQIKYKDLDIFKQKFRVKYKEFQFISRLDRIVKSERFVQCMGDIDSQLLESFPFLRSYARDIVIILDKQ